MVDQDPTNHLKQHGRRPMPPVDPEFADRLESQLRASHAHAHLPQRRWTVAWLPRLGVALTMVVLGVFGVVALTGRDAGVPVTVVDDGSGPPADVASDPPADPADDEGLAAPPTPTPVPTVPSPTLTATPSAAPTSEPTPTPQSSTTTPNATVVPADSAAAGTPATTVVTTEPTPTSTVATPPALSLTNTVTPTPPETVTVEPTAEPTRVVEPNRPRPTQIPSPTPRATAIVEPATIELVCAARRAAGAVRVVCSWDAPAVDSAISRYVVLRSLDGAEAVVVARLRPAVSTFTDRDLARGDEPVYLVRGLNDDDRVLATSTRQAVDLASAG